MKKIVIELALLLAAVSAFSVPVAAQGTPDSGGRDFSGTWTLSTGQSELRPLAEPSDRLLKIDQQGTTIHCMSLDNSAADRPGAPAREWNFDTSGKAAKQAAGGYSRNSLTKWEGSALMINTIVSTPAGDYTVMDRWKLSRDGSRLTMEREVVGRNGQAEATLVYEKEGAAKPPALVTDSNAPAPVSGAGRPVPALVREAESAKAAIAARPAEEYVLEAGTRVPLTLLSPVSSKSSRAGDRVYLDTVAPVFAHGKLILPAGSHVIGELREVKRAERAKGKSEMMMIFTTISLPNGVTREFHSRMSEADGQGPGTFDHAEGKIQGDGRRGTDAKRTAQGGVAGATIGTLAGAAAGHAGMGAGIGAAAGALGGLAGTLLTHGPDVVLPRGSTIEMVLDRELRFSAEELRRIY